MERLIHGPVKLKAHKKPRHPEVESVMPRVGRSSVKQSIPACPPPPGDHISKAVLANTDLRQYLSFPRGSHGLIKIVVLTEMGVQLHATHASDSYSRAYYGHKQQQAG